MLKRWKEIFLLICFLLFILCDSVPAQSMSAPDLKTVSLLYLSNKLPKGKKYIIEVIADDCNAYSPISLSLKDSETTEINYSYNYIDYLIVRISADNIFKDKVIGEIKIGQDNLQEYKSVTLAKEKLAIEITYRTSTGHLEKDLISSLRQNLTTQTLVRNVVQAAVNNQRSTNSWLGSHIESLKAELVDLEYDNSRLRSKLRSY